MVLFYDNEKKEQKKRKARHPVWRWTRRLIIAVTVFAALSAVGLVILGNLSGQNEALKKGVEAYLSEATGLNVRVETFEYMEIYPDVELDLGRIVFAQPKTGENMVTVNSFALEASFWDLFFTRPRMKTLNMEGLAVDESLMGYSFSVARAQLVPDPARLQVDGRFNGHDFTLTADLKSAENNGAGYFIFPPKVPVQLQSGDMTLTGQLDKSDGMTLDISAFSLPDTTMTGRVTYKKYNDTRKLAHNWDIALKSGETALDIDMAHGPDRVEGEVTANPYNISDTKDFQTLAKFVQNILAKDTGDKAAADPKAPRLLATPRIDLSLDIKNLLTSQGSSVGNMSVPLSLSDSVLKAGPFKGRLAGGGLSGDLTLSGKTDVYELTTDIMWKDWAYEELQTILTGQSTVTGTAVTELDVQGSSPEITGLPGTLEGELVTIGGQGQVDAGILNLWGKGLFSTMFPESPADMDLNMNCLIADFMIEDGIATANPLFLDTKDVTVTGEGKVNLKNNTVDLVLRPENKGATVFSSSTAVVVNGSLFAPSVRPSAKSLGASLGKLFLGTVNPAFFALSIADLGIGSGHPCYQYFPNAEGSEESGEGIQNEKPPQDKTSQTGQPHNP